MSSPGSNRADEQELEGSFHGSDSYQGSDLSYPPESDIENELRIVPPPHGVLQALEAPWIFPLPMLGSRVPEGDLTMPSTHFMIGVYGCDGHAGEHWALAKWLPGELVQTALAWVMGIKSLKHNLFFGPSYVRGALVTVRRLDALCSLEEQGVQSGCRIWVPTPGAMTGFWPGFPHADIMHLWSPLAPSPFSLELQLRDCDVVTDVRRSDFVTLSLSSTGMVKRSCRAAALTLVAPRPLPSTAPVERPLCAAAQASRRWRLRRAEVARAPSRSRSPAAPGAAA